MTKYGSFRLTVKYEITPHTLKFFIKKINFSFFSIRNGNAKPVNKRKKRKNVFFFNTFKKYTMIKEFKDELNG